MRHPRWRWVAGPAHPSRSEQGSVTVFVVSLTLALLLAAGLVFDGGRLVDARLEAADAAGAAARAGAQAMTDLRSGDRRLDPARAAAAASAQLGRSGHDGSVEVRGAEVVVTVRITRRPALLHLVGLGARTVTATRSARPVDD